MDQYFKCPSCSRTTNFLNCYPTKSKVIEGFQTTSVLVAIAHCCPMCDTVISVQVDPIALKTDIVREITGHR